MWYWIFKYIFLVSSKIFFRLKIEGLENLPQKTNYIIVVNHASYLDPLIMGGALPKKIYWLAFRGFYKIFWMRWFFQLIDTFPSGSSSPRAINLLAENKNVGLFPEGRLTQDGNLLTFRRGAALLASKTGRPIVPCAILGTFEALPLGAKFPKFVSVKIKVGKPFYLLKEFDEIIDDVYLQEGTLKIKRKIKELLDAG
jgi:1-acyl-sn-glycerol-3-phosphate acyltransferase